MEGGGKSRIPVWRPVRGGPSFKPLPLEPVTGLRTLQPATTLSRGRALAAARYVSVDPRPFVKDGSSAGAETPLLFLCHTPDDRYLKIMSAYHLHLDRVNGIYPSCGLVVDMLQQTAEIISIGTVPGLATDTTWIEIAKALCHHLGLKTVEVMDTAEIQCPTHEAQQAIGHSHLLSLQRGTSYYEGHGFRHRDHAHWRRLVASVARLPADRVKAELRALLPTLPEDDKTTTTKERLRQFLGILDRIACPPTHAECMATRLSCSGFADYEDVLSFISNLPQELSPREYPSLRRLMQLRDDSMGVRLWKATGGDAKPVTETIDGLTFRRHPGYLIVTKDERNIAHIRHSRHDSRLYITTYPPKKYVAAIFEYAARAYNLDRIYMQTMKAAFFDFGPDTCIEYVPQADSDYATAADTRAAVDAAFRVIRQTPLADLVADIRRLRREASAVGSTIYMSRGEICHIRSRDNSPQASESELLDNILTWGTHFPVAYTKTRQYALSTFIYVCPRIGWIRGRRHHREAFWKAVDMIRTHVPAVYWRVKASS